MLGRERTIDTIQRPQTSLTLPHVLSQEEVNEILVRVENKKHRGLLRLSHPAGLSISEAINLRNRAIHADDDYLFIKGGKGKRTEKQSCLHF